MRASTWTFEQSTEVPAPPDAVWTRVVTPEGINHEMRPWMSMSLPRGAEGLTIDTIELGVPVGRAWIRLFGLIPFDYDHLSVVDLEPGRRFREESTMLSMRRWVHDRTVEASTDGDATVVTDRIEFSPRWWTRLAAPLLARVLRAFFGHRHRRLVAFFAPADTNKR
ncbi:hypothetical protein [Nocardioides sp. AE5]|uniref:hypothetical protein n=1 Tax=Nocardioides sp. AE5 TaxID=2962573 RepID=UPI002880FA98|nr:hypothetical protein [Nocardioides sp. AE5]MDT0202980.1 hypothetical protein [Nocardioides sp. AE5]